MDYADAAESADPGARSPAAQVSLLPFFGTLNFRSGLADATRRVVERVTSASALLALSVSGLLGVLLAVFALGVQSVIARRRPALALAAARGAGALQLRSAMVLEGAAAVAPRLPHGASPTRDPADSGRRRTRGLDPARPWSPSHRRCCSG